MAEALIGAVSVVCKMATNRFANLPCLEVRHDFVVDFCASGPPFWSGGDPGADVLRNAVRFSRILGPSPPIAVQKSVAVPKPRLAISALRSRTTEKSFV